MTIYYCIYALFGLTSVWCANFVIKEQTARKGTCFIAFMSLFLLLGLRHPSMGVDLAYGTSYGYLGRFEYISELSWNQVFNIHVQNYERGYIIFNKIVSLFSKDRQFFLMSCAFFTLLPIIYVVYKKSVSPLLSIVIYVGLPVFLLNYSGLRQALAIGICILSLFFIQEKKPFKFVLMILFSSLFHKTALIYLIAYPFYHVKIEKILRWLSVLLIPMVYILRLPLFAVLSKILKDNAVATENDSGMLFVVFTLIYIFCIFYSNNGNEQNGLLNLFLLACLCQAFGNVYQTAMRVGYYFMITLILLLPLIINETKEKLDKHFFSIIIVVCFALFGIYSIYNSTWSMANPYYFYWENVII